jgi:glycosyltransferase involved in cell wall biosynthesis
MPLLRVFALTYRRSHLLRRALDSLVAQTFTDWICEVHNDDPADDSVRGEVEGLRDGRVSLVTHDRNLGAVGSFRIAFHGRSEPFTSLLEDDNWWEPEFLERGLAAFTSRPHANVVWANMHRVREEQDGSWTPTGTSIWHRSARASDAVEFFWPVPLQAFDALHSNGAMIFRTGPSRHAAIPKVTPFPIIEPVRERLVGGGWVLLTEPLANFAMTRETVRTPDRRKWANEQFFTACSYFVGVRPDDSEIAATWSELRRQRPRSTSILFHLALAGVASRSILRHARFADWCHFVKGSLRDVGLLHVVANTRRHLPPLLRDLIRAARARSRENIGRSGPRLWRKEI